MSLDLDVVLNWPFVETTHSYTERDVILYALGTGLGQDPTNQRELPYLYEQGLRVLPTMGSVIGHPGPWYRDPRTGIDWIHVVQGEQRLTIHNPLATHDTVLNRSRVVDVEDKGPDRGAIVRWQRTLTRSSTGELLCTVESTLFCRADGGFGGPSRPKAAAEIWPDEPPSEVIDTRISTRAALIYRLSGDLNPLHVDPKIAVEAGFERPILHGLCTFATVAYALLSGVGDGDTSALESVSARFSAPVYPGETLRTNVWASKGRARFRTICLDRDVIVLDSGEMRLRGRESDK